jgi:hypothetical protein
MKFDPSPRQPDVAEQWRLTETRFGEWLRDELFTWQWWALLALMIGTAFLICKLADRKRLVETATFTTIIILFIIILDEIGEEMSLWYYPIDVFFMFPPTTAVDISCMPLAYMLIFQWFRGWKSFALATAAMSLLFCLAVEPVFVRSGMYVMLKWKSIYGFPIYALIAFAAKAAVQLIRKRSMPCAS